jgi:hypothetical protein
MDDDDLYPEEEPSMALKMPSFLDGIIQKPDEKWRNRQIKVFGIMTLICWVLPHMAEKIIMINWLFVAGCISLTFWIWHSCWECCKSESEFESLVSLGTSQWASYQFPRQCKNLHLLVD